MCGDGLCTGPEDAAGCSDDCATGFCGDAQCNFGEDVASCNDDCGSDCCIEHAMPGCDTPYCESAVCDLDVVCCAMAWDGLCDEIASGACGGLCETPNACADLDVSSAEAASGPIEPFGDDFTASCGSEIGPEVVVEFTAPIAGTYAFDTMGSSFDTVLWAITDCTGATELACDDDAVAPQSAISLPLDAGDTILLLVGGSGGTTGTFVLNTTYP